MISSPRAPTCRARINSGIELQSKPKPRSRTMLKMRGLGSALTAKYSRKVAAPENAAGSAAPVVRMPASS